MKVAEILGTFSYGLAPEASKPAMEISPEGQLIAAISKETSESTEDTHIIQVKT